MSPQRHVRLQAGKEEPQADEEGHTYIWLMAGHLPGGLTTDSMQLTSDVANVEQYCTDARGD